MGGVTGFTTDPRTGETLTSDIVLENFQIKDYYVDRIDAYLQSIGASPGIFPNNWGPSPFVACDPSTDKACSAGGKKTMPTSSNVGDAAPIIPAVVRATHNGSDTLYQKMQGYLYPPSNGPSGPLGPSSFIVPQDADFFRAYFYLRYSIPCRLRRPEHEPVRYPFESGATNTSLGNADVEDNRSRTRQQLHALSAAIDQGHPAYDLGSATGSQDALDFLSTYKNLTVNHRNYLYAKEELNKRPRGCSTAGPTTTPLSSTLGPSIFRWRA